MSTEQFVAALTEYQLDPTEIAEILWLALRLPPVDRVDEIDSDSDDQSGEQAGDADDDIDDQLGEDDTDLDDQDGSGDDESDGEEEDSFDIAPELPSGTLPQKALPISVPDADILDDTLPLVRALKPLLKQIESQVASIFNETETVERIAETDIWSPVLNPDQEPWFELALVIDGSPAMSLWQRLIQDIQRLLRCYGSFRDFRVWQLAVSNGEVGICAASEAEPVIRSPKALLTPDARRLILVFSDCTANYWWEGSLQPILALWGDSTPTAVWQVLPDWMWKRTALGVGEYVAVRNHRPGAKNTRLTPVFLSLRASARRNSKQAETEADTDPSTLLPQPICIPVVTAESKSLSGWSRMLAGDRRYSTPGFILPPTGWQSTLPPASDESGDASEEDKIADELLENFRLRATPAARRLAALLSAAPVITLPVMRLIRASDELLPGSSPLPVAEVFLGGLLKKAPEQPDSQNPELVQYTFPHEVRDRLLSVLPKVDTIEVVEAVSKHVAERLNCTLADFRALLLSPDFKDEADRYGLRSFAKMTAQILRKVGPEFADLVQQLEGKSQTGDSETDLGASDTEWLSDLPFEFFPYEVAEYLNFPPLEPFEFVDGQPIDATEPEFPPPLQAEDVTVITLQPQPSKPQLDLERFTFTVVTLTKQQRGGRIGALLPFGVGGSRWGIERQQQQARRFVELLPGDLPLEMVAIPEGIFLMGSPDDEPERFERESPQHEVTVAPFFMGRYPVTQAQWRVVAALPQVERDLDSDAARFKGDKRPVESIAWNDAVEFCARLSQYTERSYRLPSEAEWEYACRAGTSTPFHFGDMITTEVANYNGSYTYADGPKGKARNGTTPVDHFEGANAFGLSDMHGNVQEWCQDIWRDNYKGVPTDGSVWVEGSNSSSRVYRGGAWLFNPRYCRSAYRNNSRPGKRNYGIGFRVVCSAPRALP
ncbi:MAG: SAV_2336 N-terminal domain-related protein [Leptolyngbyaceae cyanobacterium]